MAVSWAASAIDWWEEAGVDTIVGEAPRDWLSAKAPAPAARTAPAAEPLPADLDAFREWLLTSDSFPAGPRIGPSGDPASGLMMLIDMPAQEDARGSALLSGELGAMFDRMLGRIGRDRDSIYLASILPIWNPNGRLPAEDLARLAEIARRHVGLVSPRALLLFGDECSKALLGMPMTAARKRVHMLATPAGPVKAVVTMSLQFLLGQPKRRSDAMEDLNLLQAELAP
jgi:uracil-DNA glycosylase family 4